MLDLGQSVAKIPLVGPQYAQKLNHLGIVTIGDLLQHYPHRYLDRSQATLIKDLEPETEVTVVGQLTDFKNVYTRNRKNLQQATVTDGTGVIQLIWFNQKFLSQALQVGETYAFSGKVKEFRNKYSLQAPDYERIIDSQKTIHTGRLIPIYPETYGLSSKWLRSRIDYVLKNVTLTDPLPSDYLKTHHLVGLSQAFKAIHQPEDTDQLDAAKKRLGFEELLVLQIYGTLKRNQWSRRKISNPVQVDPAQILKFIKTLPFKLTRAQQKAADEILQDLNQEKPMNRLLEGDVGSGKTVVAAIALYANHLSGNTALLMAPTEILAQQHYKELSKFFSHTQIKVGLRTGSIKDKLDSDIIIGTHALLYNAKRDPNLGLVIIDEQHRFGVEQRAELESLGTHPHRLTMSATPIPRTVALTLYGDLDVSIIDELPKDRKPVKTWIVPEKKRLDGYAWIESQLKKGDQVFVVCPLIEKSEAAKLSHIKSATQEYEYLLTIFPNYTLGLLHGRLSADKKTELINQFKQNKVQILVSTQVIEVGIDVPNATIMIIEAADRFGLAQLHQLRGRVGRGTKPGYCLLYSSTDSQNRRLKALSTISSGFKLAEMDLKLRGPGEVFGLQQHGYATLKLANLTDTILLKKTRDLAQTIVSQDHTLSKFQYYLEKIKPFQSQKVIFN